MNDPDDLYVYVPPVGRSEGACGATGNRKADELAAAGEIELRVTATNRRFTNLEGAQRIREAIRGIRG